VWSPDGRFVPYPGAGDTPGVVTAKLLDVRTGEGRPLGIDLAAGPDFTWSPTGRELVIHVVDAATRSDAVRIVTIATGATRTVPLPTAAGQTTRLEAWTTSNELYVSRRNAAPSTVAEFQLLDVQTGQTRPTCVGDPRNVGGSGYPYRDLKSDVCLGLTPDGAAQLLWLASSRRLVVRDPAKQIDRPRGGADARHGAPAGPPARPESPAGAGGAAIPVALLARGTLLGLP
jgi:hypothetical protein